MKPGDRVMQVWACCHVARLKRIGWESIIERVYESQSVCPACRVIRLAENCGAFTDGGQAITVPLSWLIKMPPDSEIKHNEEEREKVT